MSAKRRGFIDSQALLTRLDEALHHALVVHCFGYGEPTLHPKFGEILDFLTRYKVVMDFFTNGMHLTPELVATLVDKKVHAITVSFSGATKDVYENIYLGGKFEEVLAGIKRLAAYKKQKNSEFPIIQVNSLGFKDHIANIEPFVRLMADHGVDVIHVKPLQSVHQVPQLYEHIAVPRVDIEAKAVRRAMALGEELGVRVSAVNYLRQALSDDDNYQSRMAQFRELAASNPTPRPYGENPVSSFRDDVQAVKPEKPQHDRPEPVMLGDDASEFSTLRDVVKPRGGGETEEVPPFYCMEPFKTLYVLREGRTKPCCFASDARRHMGDIGSDDALEVWRQGAFASMRDNIVDVRYPKTVCGACLRKKSGPPNHFARLTVAKYLAWYRSGYGDDLHNKLLKMDARYLDKFKITSADVIAKVRSRRDQSARTLT